MDAATLWRAVSVLVLAWLAFFFGRTLATGQQPLIERIARVSDPQMPEPLQRYTRWLTATWAAYFVAAALVTALVEMPVGVGGAWVWLGTAALFIGEHSLRPFIFPGRQFPGLIQQLRDTW